MLNAANRLPKHLSALNVVDMRKYSLCGRSERPEGRRSRPDGSEQSVDSLESHSANLRHEIHPRNIPSYHQAHHQSVLRLSQDGTPMFIAKDVADALGYARPSDAVATHCKRQANTAIRSNSSEQARSMTIIPESDVYRLVMRSKLVALYPVRFARANNFSASPFCSPLLLSLPEYRPYNREVCARNSLDEYPPITEKSAAHPPATNIVGLTE